MPASSVAIAIAPPSASTSRTRWPLPIPPIDGLHDIWPSVSMLCVNRSVDVPARAAARAASVPAWPPPTTITPKRCEKSMILKGNFLCAMRRDDPLFYAKTVISGSRFHVKRTG
jgi:hypothetical protein